ncbi:hypothetical protein L2X99_04940 [Microbacterium sp. KUDC0406]|uniref:hypothetical protein n=1 Tax=Microbacterium sp. KUDC0406 TaxID=2909588 RepID=UPI001F16EFE8|nr:hypothetical protein [Microbacterium sp. KUDC0406]UJP10955.1 hypothetical protein L2X99_04940 [Microbacterium sp. KUDC0406]
MNPGLLRTRTPERPMAFTFREFLRGMWAAWGLFLVILLVCLIVLPIVLGGGAGVVVFVVYGMMYGGAISVVTMAVFSPAAWVLGWCLRRVRARSAHLVAFAMLGTVIGLIVGVVLAGGSAGPSSTAVSLAFAGASAIAVALGWRFTTNRALAEDDPGPKVGMDAAFDDHPLGA